MHKMTVGTLLVICFVLLLTGTSGLWGDTLRPVSQEPKIWEWPQSDPETQDLDKTRLTKLVEVIREGRQYPRLHSLLIVRHGYLVLEEYFGGFEGSRLHTLQSVSKSFTSALIGIAINRGDIKSVDEKILDFFPDIHDIANMDERKESIRLKDLLTMRSGTDYHEGDPGSDTPHTQLNSLPRGWDKFYLDRPMLRDPGTQFLYDSGGVILLSSILKNRTGKHADEYAEHYLFGPLQIEKKFWVKNQEGHPHTGGGLNLAARDTAKLGLLYLNNGRWEKKQIIPEEWIRESFNEHVSLNESNEGVIGYGYLWWILAPDPGGEKKENIYAAMGFKGQYIFVVPEHDMVVVVNGDTRSRVDQRRPIEFLYSHILPAIKR